MEKYTCPCCGYKTLVEEHECEICPICFWEDDWFQFENPDTKGANCLTLRQAQQSYIAFGACERDMLLHVRNPGESDVKDENWRLLAPAMKVSVILAHPYPKSFNHAIAETVRERLSTIGHDVFFHDLYAEGFDPVILGHELVSDIPPDELVKQHIDEIKEAEGIVIIHPNWWGQPPAILKGWVDRVLRQGVAYQFDEDDNGGGIPAGLLKAKAVLVFNTSNTPEARENEVFGDPLETLWRNCIFGFCGVTNVHRRMFRVVADSTEEQRKEWLEEVGEIAERYY